MVTPNQSSNQGEFDRVYTFERKTQHVHRQRVFHEPTHKYIIKLPEVRKASKFKLKVSISKRVHNNKTLLTKTEHSSSDFRCSFDIVLYRVTSFPQPIQPYNA